MAERLTIDYARAGEQIKAARIAQHLSQEEFAERIGFSAQYLSNIENSNTKAGLIAFINIANGLGLSLDRLFGGTLSPSKSIAASGIETLLADCTDYELVVMAKALAGLKDALREAERIKR